MPLSQIITELQNRQNFLIISHRSPDCDAVGTNLALKKHLQNSGKEVQSFCVDPIPENLKFLYHAKQFQTAPLPTNLENYDCIIFVDCASQAQTGLPEDLFSQLPPHILTINIDHHPSNTNFANLNYVEPTAASTTVIIHQLLKQIRAQICPQIATCLLSGIYFDTGSFKHSNTCAQTFKIASDLLSLGANHRRISQKLFRNHSISQLRLLGQILEKSQISDQNIVYSSVTQTQLNQLGLSSSATQNAIDYLNMVPKANFCLLMKEDDQGRIKCSTRTQKKEVDLSQLAQLLGGGGHRQAAGFSLKGQIEKDLQL